MSRPIPVEIVPSHVHLSEADHIALFGNGHVGTVAHALSQNGQFAYEESVEVFGRLKRGLELRVLGPHRKQSQVEVTPTEADYLGLDVPEAKSGDLRLAAPCRLKGPAGEIMLEAAVIVPRSHVHLSDNEAKSLRLNNGVEVSVDIMGDHPRTIEHVIVRVHPTYRARLHIHPDIARGEWLSGVHHVRIRELQHV
ncbi:MAG: PduL/EutD family phosphate acyltransferase [Candidatus Uhrbacteria bacterium]|nr:PduL/EutD family phosphate acyltransferase [Candidatus Uhrbacteria bacterium]